MYAVYCAGMERMPVNVGITKCALTVLCNVASHDIIKRGSNSYSFDDLPTRGANVRNQCL